MGDHLLFTQHNTSMQSEPIFLILLTPRHALLLLAGFVLLLLGQLEEGCSAGQPSEVLPSGGCAQERAHFQARQAIHSHLAHEYRADSPLSRAFIDRGALPLAGSADVVLSSGFLAFASHSGFLEAVERVSTAT
jgi:hypothetical protein